MSVLEVVSNHQLVLMGPNAARMVSTWSPHVQVNEEPKLLPGKVDKQKVFLLVFPNPLEMLGVSTEYWKITGWNLKITQLKRKII